MLPDDLPACDVSRMPRDPNAPVTEAELVTVRSAIYALGLSMLCVEDILEALVNDGNNKVLRWNTKEQMRELRSSLEELSRVIGEFPGE